MLKIARFSRMIMRTVISILYYPIVLAWSVFYFLLMCAAWLLTVLFDRERVVLHRMSHLWAHSIVWVNPLWRLKVTGRENVSREESYVVTVNHQSMIDIPLMYVLPKINFKWVAKREVYRWPLFGAVLWFHGDIVVEQGSARAARGFMAKGKERLAGGTSVVIFPEGTRSSDGAIHNYKEGAFLLAKEAGVPILPCVVNGARDFIKGWRINRTTFEIAIMPPVAAERVAEVPTRELMAEVREASMAKLEQLRKIDN
jgi:1-acyl-sn-glycerol-3-phosphate acyltransferase